MRRLLFLALILLIIVGGFAAAIPIALSTTGVKQRIANQLADWTGRRVSFRGNPRVEALPYVRVKISDVTIGDPKSDEPFISMESLTSNMRLLALLFGRVEIAEFRLNGPKIHLRRDRDGRNNWTLRQVPREERRPAPATLLRLNRITIRDGAITLDDALTGRHETITAANLSLAWRGAGDPIVGVGSFRWRDETVDFNGSIGDPIGLNEGRASPARFALASTPLRLSFNGNISGIADLQVDGPATVSTPSLRRLVGWLGMPTESGATFGAASIEGKLNWSRPTLIVADARIELDGNHAEGTVSARLAGPRPRIQGTLAAETLDLTPYLEAFRAELNASSSWALAPIRAPGLSAIDVDARLSAGQVLLGSAHLGEVAIAAGVTDGKISVDIGEAKFYSGTLAATLNAEMRNSMLTGTVEARLSDVPAGVALADFAGVKSIDGTGAASLRLAGSGRSWGELAYDLAGTAQVSLADGAVAGLDLDQVAAMLGGTPSGPPAARSTRFAKATCSLKIAGGEITTEDLSAEGDRFRIDLSGEASLFEPGVSGRGTLTIGNPDGTAAATSLPFELGGTWQELEVLPDLGPPIQRGELSSPGKRATR
jgi:AsmA protein